MSCSSAGPSSSLSLLDAPYCAVSLSLPAPAMQCLHFFGPCRQILVHGLILEITEWMQLSAVSTVQQCVMLLSMRSHMRTTDRHTPHVLMHTHKRVHKQKHTHTHAHIHVCTLDTCIACTRVHTQAHLRMMRLPPAGVPQWWRPAWDPVARWWHA